MCSTQPKPLHKFAHAFDQFNISFVLTMTSADFSQGHTQHQILLSFMVHVLYISIVLQLHSTT